MEERELCHQRERKALRRRLVLTGWLKRKANFSPRAPMPTLGAIRQMVLGNGVRVELPKEGFGTSIAVPAPHPKASVLRRMWQGVKSIVRRRP